MYRRLDLEARALAIVPLLLVGGVSIPLIFLFIAALSSSTPGDPSSRPTLENMVAVYTSREFLEALGNSLSLGVITGLGAIAIALPIAWLLNRTDVPWRHGFDRLMTFSFYVSPLVLAMSWVAIAGGRAGYANVIWRSLTGGQANLDVHSVPGIVFVSVIHFVPLAYLLISTSLRSMSGALEEASAMCGASRMATLRRVVLPLQVPAIAASFLQVAVFGAEQFAVPWFLGVGFGYRTIPALIYEVTSRFAIDFNQAAAAGTMLLFFTIAGLFAFRFLIQQQSRYATIGSKYVPPRVIQLGRTRVLATLLVVVYLLLAIGMPLAALAWGSFNTFPSPTISLENVSLRNWTQLFNNSQIATALTNSVVTAVVTATLTVAFGLLCSFVVLRTKTFGRTATDYASALPMAVPGIALGLGFVWFYSWSPLPLYGSLFGLGLAYGVRYIGHAIRMTSAGLVQIQGELLEAATMCRAGVLRVVKDILLPLLRANLLASWAILFVFFIQELNVTIMVYRANTITTSVYMFNVLSTSTQNAVYPIALLLLAVTFAAVLLSGRARSFGAQALE